MSSPPRVRFAPSPTGFLHLGNIKIALLNYLFARKNGGVFVLRIDDTDMERSSRESEEAILEDLRWMGLEWDEFYRQSERMTCYEFAVQRLRESGRLYACYETREELASKKNIQAQKGIPPIYDRSSLFLESAEKRRLEELGTPVYWRFKLNDIHLMEWQDLVHGKISIPLSSLSDPILVRTDGSFVYTLTSVVDDIDLGITHVIRGGDHITNTAIQLDILAALGGKNLEFAHVPLMSAPDHQEISKRSGSAFSLRHLRDSGILPEAIFNFLASLGTSHNPSIRDSRNELMDRFSFDDINLASPKLHMEELKLLSKKMLGGKNFDEIKDSLKDRGLEDITCDWWYAVRNNIDSIADLHLWRNIFRGEIDTVAVDLVFLRQMLDTLEENDDFDAWISKLKQVSGRQGKKLFAPLRLAITGLEHGPELKKIGEIIGYGGLRSRLVKNIEIQQPK
jgi:glutamyl-tRNA synthetase